MYKLNLPVIVFIVIGLFFYGKAFNSLWILIVLNTDPEILRRGDSFSIYFSSFNEPPFLFLTGFLKWIGLLIGSYIGYRICKARRYRFWNLVISFIIAVLLNKLIDGDLHFTEYTNVSLQNYPVPLIFWFNFILTMVIGTLSFIFILYLRYFKYSNTENA